MFTLCQRTDDKGNTLHIWNNNYLLVSVIPSGMPASEPHCIRPDGWIPVPDRHQVSKASCQPDIGNIRAPDLVTVGNSMFNYHKTMHFFKLYPSIILLIVLITAGCSTVSYKKSGKVQAPERVMAPGMIITQESQQGRIKIEAINEITRKYSWDNQSEVFELIPQKRD
jgi:hypothetical protein